MIMVQKSSHSLSLLKLIKILNFSSTPNITDIIINGITLDSRTVKPGYMFAAVQGADVNGADFIPAAIAKGASIILCAPGEQQGQLLAEVPAKSGNFLLFDCRRRKISPKFCMSRSRGRANFTKFAGTTELLATSVDNVTKLYQNSSGYFLTNPNPRLVLALIAAEFYQSQPEIIVAVTGTNGKTSTAYFCTEIWQLLGKKSASIGTIGIVTSGGLAPNATGSMTTPDQVKLHEILSNLAAQNINYLAMEASSHGLDQYRLDGVRIKAAAFSNITRDHLDYHGSFANYLKAKLRIFDIMHEGVAVINADIPEAEQIIALCEAKRHKILSIGRKGKYIELFDITPTKEGQQIAFEVLGRLYTVNTHLIGEFQAYNLLTALALVVGSGANIDEAVDTLSKVNAVPGRMQGVLQKDGMARIYIDYAHTPDALEKAIKVLRPYTKGKLWVLFGCGGDRDKGKRPQMGEIAKLLADHIVITDDNPRSEVPATIRSEIMAACPAAIEIGDRAEAIAYAIKNMQPNDMLLIAGKGHEKMQIIGDKKMEFDDVKVATGILELVE